MSDGVNAAAPHVIPFFAPGADGSDQLMVTVAVILLVAVLTLGVLFFWVHSLPERMAHRTQKVQMEIVAVLCLLALFTHVHAFWVAGLLLALLDLPTMTRPVERIAGSLERIADRDGPPAMLPDPSPPDLSPPPPVPDAASAERVMPAPAMRPQTAGGEA
jgi:hypothetical protein